ncbi:MAG: ORF6N domain-containing protein [Candidatus Delongbacteria bacterium]|jgi:hypothetical protein|nr:ORF6N domain-containing protein [Candidatus Delongbacteria bacterium]
MTEYEMEKFEESLKDKIYSVRGFQVMLDRDLAELYGVETKVLNQAVKRNIERFPSNYYFQLNISEYAKWKSQIVTSIGDKMGLRKKPFVFTEHGVAMLSAVLKSKIAVNISIKIIDAFIEMRKFLQSNSNLFFRLGNLETTQYETTLKLIETDKRVDKIFSLMESGEIKPKQGILFDKQVFDAYKYVSDIVKSADKSVMIIDNYVDDSVLTILSKRRAGVKAMIYTKNISSQLNHDVKKFNEQYEPVELVEFDNSHDRFIVIDEKVIYHFGASLKDLGKKWFGFSKMEVETVEMLSRLKDFK